MKTEAVVAQSWDDLVFENRNKEYGAYSVRKSYSDRILYGLFITLSGVAFALVAPALVAMVRGEEVKIIQPKDILEVVIKPKIYEIIRPEPPAAQPARAQQQVRTAPRNVPPVVTSDPVIAVQTPEEPVVDNFVEPGEPNGPTVAGDPAITSGGTGEGVTAKTHGDTWILRPEIMPEFVGGEKEMIRFLQRAIHYPSSARRIGVDGRVFISFVIGVDGTITNAEIVRGISADCDAEALRVVNKMPRWKPGRQNDSPVAVRMVLPIRFLVDVN